MITLTIFECEGNVHVRIICMIILCTVTDLQFPSVLCFSDFFV